MWRTLRLLRCYPFPRFSQLKVVRLSGTVHLPIHPARCAARRRHSSINFSTSLGSNLRGLLPGPIFTAGRYGLRLPEACWMTQETLTRSFLATSFALTSCRIGWLSRAVGSRRSPRSVPLECCMLTSYRSVVSLLFTAWRKSCQTSFLDFMRAARPRAWPASPSVFRRHGVY